MLLNVQVRRLLVPVIAAALLWLGGVRLHEARTGTGPDLGKATHAEWLLVAPDFGVKKPWSDSNSRPGHLPFVVTRLSLGRPDTPLAAVAKGSLAPVVAHHRTTLVGVVELRI